MKIYTKKGDKGETSLVDGSKVKKSTLRIETYGTVDELNSHLGILSSLLEGDEQLSIARYDVMHLQTYLFQMGSQLACVDEEMAQKLPQFKESLISELEDKIDKMDEKLPELKNFILPGGHPGASQAHVCRTICRRAERLCVKLDEEEKLRFPAVVFLNRLSDYFFVLARHINHQKGIPSHEWKPE
jgi:cob(I)alamin adenosyltransferase